jgi:hypothetical protein
METILRRITAITILFLLTACLGTLSVDEFDKLMRFDLPDLVGEEIDLSEETTFGWDQVSFYGPYTPFEQIETETGFLVSRNLEQEYVAPDVPAHVSESEGVVVFTAGGSLVRGYHMPRSVVDISALSGHVFDAGNARFRVVERDSWILLEPNG